MKKSYKVQGQSKIPTLFLLIVGLILITSCDKDDDQNPLDKLPPITQNGAQTFGCLINGKPFIPPKLLATPQGHFTNMPGGHIP